MSQNKFSSFHFFSLRYLSQQQKHKKKTQFDTFQMHQIQGYCRSRYKTESRQVNENQEQAESSQSQKECIKEKKKRINCDIEKLGIRQNTKLDMRQSIYLVRLWT